MRATTLFLAVLLFFTICSAELRPASPFQFPKSQVSPLSPPVGNLRKDKGTPAVINNIDQIEDSDSISDGLSSSLMMILVSEMGDETFIIAAIMAMRQNRYVVLIGALSALYVMTILSTALGFAVPNILSKEMATHMATILYIFFGLRLFYIAYFSQDEDDEIEEVEEMLEKKKKEKTKKPFLVCSPLFLEAFLLTFSAEWGDRSQIATIALASHKNPIAVTIGACLGHTVCTSIAVYGGRMVASKISQRTVAIAGGLTFFVFAIYNIIFHELN